MSELDQTVLFEQFVAARENTITLTDRFCALAVDDSVRAKLREHVVRQAETARLVLERWLRFGQLTDQVATIASATLAAFEALDVKRLVLISPYVAATHQHEIDFLTEAGLSIFLSCTNIHSPEVVVPLETRIHKPVITSNQAVLWYALRACGQNAIVPGLGRLFKYDLPRRLSAAGQSATIAPGTWR